MLNVRWFMSDCKEKYNVFNQLPRVYGGWVLGISRAHLLRTAGPPDEITLPWLAIPTKQPCSPMP